MHLQIESDENILDVILQDNDHALIIVTDYKKDVSTSFKLSKNALAQLKVFLKWNADL